MKNEHLGALLSSKKSSKSSSKSVTPCLKDSHEAREPSVFDHPSADIHRADFASPVWTIFKLAQARDKFRVRIVDRP
jgi:hypothetical protein